MASFFKFWALTSLTIPIICAPAELTGDVELYKRQNVTSIKGPIIASPSQQWEGLDGNWSTFAIRLGTPPRVVRLLPATTWSETWAIHNIQAGACDAQNNGTTPAGCGDARGGVFDYRNSQSWEPKGSFDLGLHTDMGYSGFGEFGFDKVGLGYDDSNGEQFENQVVGRIQSDWWWLGLFGLSPEPVNYTDFGHPQPSFMGTLNEKKQISSQSWSYTAGARYRNKGTFGSLIFGGYDASRFESNDVGFSMAEDISRDLVITLRLIMTDLDGEETQLMNTAEFMFIDSSVPEIWLPKEACDKFEDTFDLKYDEASQQYIVDEEAHDNLVEQNPNITFTLANQKDGGSVVDIVLPYQAFDLTMSKPLWAGKGNTTFYFPIRRADNSTLYTLGRTFLQEAYVTAHYNSRTFNVSQATHPDPLSPDVVALPANLNSSESEFNPDSTKNDPRNSDGGGVISGGLAGGAIAGIIVAAVLVGVLIVTLIFFCCPCGFCPAFTFYGFASGAARKRQEKLATVHEKPVEIDGTRVPATNGTVYGEQASKTTAEMPGQDSKVEIAGNPIMHPQEMEAEVPPEFVTGRQRASAELDGSTRGSNSGQNISSDTSRQYHSDSGGGVSDVSGESPETRHARLAEVHENGFRPTNGPVPRLGNIEEVVSPVTPTSRHGGFGRR